jgi:hypothetical protein
MRPSFRGFLFKEKVFFSFCREDSAAKPGSTIAVAEIAAVFKKSLLE